MWSEKLQPLKGFDLQFTGKAPAACEMAHLLSGLCKGDRGRIAPAIKEYATAISDAGLPYTFEEVCQDMAWMLLQQLIHFMIDTP